MTLSPHPALDQVIPVMFRMPRRQSGNRSRKAAHSLASVRRWADNRAGERRVAFAAGPEPPPCPRSPSEGTKPNIKSCPLSTPRPDAALKANVALRGVTVPVVRDEGGYLLDGFGAPGSRRNWATSALRSP